VCYPAPSPRAVAPEGSWRGGQPDGESTRDRSSSCPLPGKGAARGRTARAPGTRPSRSRCWMPRETCGLRSGCSLPRASGRQGRGARDAADADRGHGARRHGFHHPHSLAAAVRRRAPGLAAAELRLRDHQAVHGRHRGPRGLEARAVLRGPAPGAGLRGVPALAGSMPADAVGALPAALPVGASRHGAPVRSVSRGCACGGGRPRVSGSARSCWA